SQRRRGRNRRRTIHPQRRGCALSHGIETRRRGFKGAPAECWRNAHASMSAGEVHALHYATREPLRVKWAAGRITEMISVTEKPSKEVWIAPALVDLQINGYAGVDFQQDHLTGEDLLRAARALRRDGCAHFLATLITDDWARL